MPSRSWASALVAAIAAGAWLIGCADGDSQPPDDASLSVYVSLPTAGPAARDGRDAADGARLALADAGDQAGGFAVRAVFLESTVGEGAGAHWSPARSAENARRATQDSTAVAYLGDFESGATRASLPVTNEARMLQVSPASGAVDLVAPFRGSDDVPPVQPSGERSFGRVIGADDLQAENAASWAQEIGWRRVGILAERGPFARTLADAFREEAGELGLAVARGGADRTYLAGGPEAAAPDSAERELLGSDALLAPYARRPLPAPALATSAALDPAQLPAAGRRLVGRFRETYGRRPGRYAAYGYEAMAVILDSIERSSDPADRTAAVDAFFATENRDSVLGTYSISELGETTLDAMTGYALDPERAPRPAIELPAPG